MMQYERGERIPAKIVLADGYDSVTHAGVAVVAADTGRVLLAQRAYDETDAPDVRETWEFPGGGLDDGEDPHIGAFREFYEEIGMDLMIVGEVVDGWRAPNGTYQGFVVVVPNETLDLPDPGRPGSEAEPLAESWEPNDEVQAVRWCGTDDIMHMIAEDLLRPEMLDMDWSLLNVSGNEDSVNTQPCIKCGMTLKWNDREEEWQAPDGSIGCDEGGSHEVKNPSAAMVSDDEPEWDDAAFDLMPIPIHGILAPEDTETGDQRGFNAGSMTARPTRLPFAWQEVSIGGHDGSAVVGGLDRMMRKDGMIHYEGHLMPSARADQFADLLLFFGRFGVSVDGDRGNLDVEKSMASGVMWFDAVRASGLTAVSIPAFHEAYVAFGLHSLMPAADATLTASMQAAGDLVTFDRGPGWVTNPKETNRLHDYWTKKGQPGYAKIRWGTPGDFTRAKRLIGEKIAKNSPEKMKYLNQIIAQWHFDALGYWPGDLDKPGNKTTAEARAERAGKKVATGIEVSDDGGWEAVLTASGGERVLPPLSYFHRHPNTGATTIEEPDANGIRRVHGYAAERGVCHIGFAGQCVEAPMDEDSLYPEFHLGRTKTAEGYINTGLATYGIDHRDADTILAESATQQHFDNLAHAWAAVRCGTDERGTWYSGVVLPTVPDKWITAIEASGQVSGEWKYGALRTLLTVNVPGFPVQPSSATVDADGNVIALVASAHGDPYMLAESDHDCFTENCGALAEWGVWISPTEQEFYCDTHYAATDTNVTWSCAEVDDPEVNRLFLETLKEGF
jgi:8-oxo-dGTP pyrophosphatase MutT (NUDIX family)